MANSSPNSPAPVRILIVDDSVVIRKLLTTTLAEVPGFEVVASAALGSIALTKIPEVRPDIVILDVEMPEMDGLETLRRIRKDWPRLPVIMFSTRTDRGAAVTIEALTSGASDFVTKPSNVGNVMQAMARVREEMVPKILALTASARAVAARLPQPQPAPRPALRPAAARPAQSSATTTTAVLPVGAPQRSSFAAGARSAPSPSTPPPTSRARPVSQPIASRARPVSQPITAAIARPRSVSQPIAARNPGSRPILLTEGPIRLAPHAGPRLPIELIAIGASTGGPNALAIVLGQLPADFSVPIVIVQHMLPTFTRHFAERLAAQCQIKIVEAAAGAPLEPGVAYIARGDHHLLVERRAGRVSLATNQDPLENFCRPAVDVLFRSVAQSHGPAALGIVLTGMGHDGLIGCGAIRDAGGDVIVQDEASSVVWGMPGFVARAGLASSVLPLDHMAPEIRRRMLLTAPRALGAAP